MRGDHFLVLPALRALARLFMGRLTLICATGARARYFADLELRGAIEIPFDLEGDGEFDAGPVVRALGNCDLFVSLLPWYPRSLHDLLNRLAPAVTVGLRGDPGHVIPSFGEHAADVAFAVARSFDERLILEEYSAAPVFSPEAQAVAAKLRGRLPPSARVLVLHSETKRLKKWTDEHFAEVLDGFLARHPDFVAVVVDEKPSPIAAGAHGGQIFSFAENPIDVAFCLVATADYFLGVDSCMLHVADFCRVPGVGLFGPSSSREFGFRLAPHVHVCGDGSMGAIRTSHVLDALENVVERFPLRNERRGLP